MLVKDVVSLREIIKNSWHMEQVYKYAVNPAIQRLAGSSTQLHTLCGQVKGTELLRAEEV